MNFNDPRNVILTIPQGFDFCLAEYEKLIGCKLEVLTVPTTDTDKLIKQVISYGSKHGGVPIRVKSWSPLVFEKKLNTFDGEEIWECFSILALRIKGSLEKIGLAKEHKKIDNIIIN